MTHHQDSNTAKLAVSALAQIVPVLEAGGPELTRLLAATERRLGEIADAGGEKLGTYASETLDAGGKRLRPLLVFLCGGVEQSDRLLAAAVAVELLHMATLVHDDVLDNAALRRGRPTVVATGGREAATATGDMLFSRAFAELASAASVEAVASLSAASSALARGELMQRADAWSTEVGVERYLTRCRLKTARLFESACTMGAALGRPGPDAAPALGLFGDRLGLAFQILDDVLDVSGPTERTGKARGADLLDGTVTLPLILALERDPELRKLDLIEVVTGPAQAEAFCDRITLTGALGTARETALGYVAEAKAVLYDVDLTEGQRKALDLVADGVVDRYA